MTVSPKIILPGGAGLVGQNLIAVLLERGFSRIVVLDKHERNLQILRSLYPEVKAVAADLSQPGAWMDEFKNASSVVMLQAQIGGLDWQDFERNNVKSTELILQTMHHCEVKHLVHVSSSVVQSAAHDFYTRSKTAQEEIVRQTDIPHIILRPTLMFGWFDRKHLGWLSRFMKKSPIFPIPGDGRFDRQPLYVLDFCRVIATCVEERRTNGIYDISGLEHVDYIDLIRAIKRATGASTILLKIPVGLFAFLLDLWSRFDRNPPFTSDQLRALMAGDQFKEIDWPGIFKVRATPFEEAVRNTFQNPKYSRVTLEF